MSADPEIDILKTEENLTNGDIDQLYTEEELGLRFLLLWQFCFKIYICRNKTGKAETKISVEKKSEHFYKKKVYKNKMKSVKYKN